MKRETRVYFDNAATTPLDREVLEAMLPYMTDHFGNPSSIHSHGRESRTAIERARKKVAELLNTSPSEIFFTSGGTEADNTAIRCGIEAYDIQHTITSRIEHHAVLHTLEHLEKIGKIRLSYVELDEKGNVNLQHLQSLLSENERSLVSLMHGNNEIGNLTDIATVGEICAKHRAIFHSDTVQTIGHFPMDLQQLKAHCIVGAAHKFHGPKGVGFLYINNDHKIHPFVHGGAQERNMRGGTENLYGIVGMAKALEIACENMEEHRQYILGLKIRMIEQLKEKVPGVIFHGESSNLDKSLYTVINAGMPPSEDNDMLLFNLDIQKISVSGGSACSSGSSVGSHVLSALNIDPKRGAVRISFSKFNTTEEVDYVANNLAAMYAVKV
jgi:cysteine desulfurase